jgi:predicted nucleic acid-binding protein
MTRYVVDSNVVAKWFVVEDLTDEALRLNQAQHQFLAPDLLLLEVAQILLKKWRRSAFDLEDVRPIVDFMAARFELRPSVSLLPRALDLAVAHQRSVYDALYLTVAVAENCSFVTADRTLYEALATGFGDLAVWVGDLPEPSDV